MIQLIIAGNVYNLTEENEQSLKILLKSIYSPGEFVVITIDNQIDDICELQDIFNV